MSSKTFIFVPPTGLFTDTASLHSIEITTTDGLFPSGGELNGEVLHFLNPQVAAQSNNIDWTKTCVKMYDYASNNSRFRSDFIKSEVLRSFSFDRRYLVNGSDGESWNIPSVSVFYLNITFKSASSLTINGSNHGYQKSQLDGWVYWGGSSVTQPFAWNPSIFQGDINGSQWKFRTQAAIDAYILGYGLKYNIQSLNAPLTKLNTFADGRVAYISDSNTASGWSLYSSGERKLYQQEFTLSSPVTADNIGIFLSRNTVIGGSIDVKIHSCSRAVLASNLSRTPEYSATITLNSAIHEMRSNKIGFVAYAALPSLTTFPAGTYTLTVTPSAGVDNSMEITMEQSVTGSTMYSSINAAQTSFQAYTNTRLPFVLAQKVVANYAPTDINLSSSTIAENAGANAVVGTFSATDVEGGAMTYSLVAGAGDTHNSLFNISGSSLRANASFNYENMPAGAVGKTLSVRVQATDSGGLSYSKALTITVTDAAEAPSNITLSASSIQEGNAVGAVIGTLSAIDPDTGDTSFTFSIQSGGDKFSIQGSTLKAAAAFDYETATSHSVTVRATDAGGLYFDKAFTISVLNNTADDPVSVNAAAQVSVNGKIKLEVAKNPKVAAVTQTVNGQAEALPVGSVVRDITTGAGNKKYVKLAGAATNYLEIFNAPPPEWKWNEDGATAWAILQDI